MGILSLHVQRCRASLPASRSTVARKHAGATRRWQVIKRTSFKSFAVLHLKSPVVAHVSSSENIEELVGQIEGIEGYGAISTKPATPLLDTINFPSHLKSLTMGQLNQVAKELRADLIYNVSQTGGHLGSSLGVIELTVALNYVFDQPEDKIIWDVGHQAYPHKILTGRRDKMNTMRQTGGLSPFTKRSESPYDCFGAGHSSTSISAGLGMAVARDMQGEDFHVISIIGDGAITGGMSYEAMNNAGFLDTNMIIILNDNQQVSLPTQYNSLNQDPVGALSSTFARLQSSRPLRELR